ncbi:MAG: ECF transporter S component [Candidatus Limosilactobacillus intestinavium]|jgi:ECF transporter S component (folate family)
MDKSTQQLKKLIFAALLLAITIVFGRIFIIPIPWTHGNVNLCDAGILIAAMLLGPVYGTAVGGLGGLFLDLISGYTQYAPFSLIAHGLEGLLAGWLYKKTGKNKLAQYGANLVAVLVMVICYFFADSILYNWAAGVLGIGTNILQGIVGMVIAVLIVPTIKKRINI